MSKTRETIAFVTSNRGKFVEVSEILAPFGVRLKRVSMELSEPRSSDVRAIVAAKAEQALARVRGPVLVEDTGIFFGGYPGFPGAYSKLFVESVGLKGVLRLLCGGRRNAFFQTIVGYAEPGKRVRFFVGLCGGVLTSSLRGAPHHPRLPYDAVFVPRGSRKTFAQMTRAEKARCSHRARAFRAFGRWFERR